MIERIALPAWIVREIERRARSQRIAADEVASRLVAEELPRLVADLLAGKVTANRGTSLGLFSSESGRGE